MKSVVIVLRWFSKGRHVKLHSDPMLAHYPQRRTNIGPTLVLHWSDVSRLLGWPLSFSLTVTTGKLHFVDEKVFNTGSHRRRWTNIKPTQSQCHVCVIAPSHRRQAAFCRLHLKTLLI